MMPPSTARILKRPHRDLVVAPDGPLPTVTSLDYGVPVRSRVHSLGSPEVVVSLIRAGSAVVLSVEAGIGERGDAVASISPIVVRGLASL